MSFSIYQRGDDFWNNPTDEPSGLTTENVFIDSYTENSIKVSLVDDGTTLDIGDYFFRGSFSSSANVNGMSLLQAVQAGYLTGSITSEYQESGQKIFLQTYNTAAPMSYFSEVSSLDDTAESLAEYYSGDDTFDLDPELRDVPMGFGGNDVFIFNSGGDIYNGGEGLDVVTVAANKSELGSITAISNGYNGLTGLSDLDGFLVEHASGESEKSATLIDVERIEFQDGAIALDVDGATSAGGIYRLYKATFNREPDTGGLGYWIAQADDGVKDAVRMAEDFTWSAEFQNLYGITTKDNYGTGTDVRDLVTGFYENVLGRAPDAGGLNYYTGVIESHEKTVGRVLAEISDSAENYDNTIGLIQNGIQYDLWVG